MYLHILFLSKYDRTDVVDDRSRAFLPEHETTNERGYRFRAFKNKLRELDNLNAAERVRNGTAVFGISMTSDHSPAEFISKYLEIIPLSQYDGEPIDVAKVSAYKGSATSVDWTGTLTTPIKNQGQWGTDW